jgi:tryptophan 7-halogenase
MQAQSIAPNITSVVIVGGGTAGWMAAAALARTLNTSVTIRLVDSEAISTVGVGEASIPQIKLFNQLLGIDENDFLRHTQGTIKLGIEFNNWRKPKSHYLHAFSGIGIDFGMIEFHHYWLKSLLQHNDSLNNDKNTQSLWDYSTNAVAAYQHKFKSLNTIGNTRLPGIQHAYHFDATLFADYLRTYSERLNVEHIRGKVTHVSLRPDGFIASISLENDRVIEGDLFIDCTGFHGLLIEKTLATGYEDWSYWLPCDRAVVVPSASVQPLLPYTTASAQPAGWQWRIPLQHRTGNGHVYCSKFMSDDEAAAILLRNLDAAPLAEPKLLRFVTGKRKKFWNKNCVALGLASGFMEPLESTSIHLVQFALGKLIDMFPRKDFSEEIVAEFNTQLSTEYEHIRDFLILHYHLTERNDSGFWQHCRTMKVPERVTRKINLFKKTGKIYREANELFAQMGWLQVMLGQGIVPESYHPFADKMSAAQLTEHLAYLKNTLQHTIAQLPSHDEYIAQIQSERLQYQL